MAFTGWPDEAIAFYEGLEADNTKAFWAANRERWDACVLGPMEDLLDELESRFGRGKVFRPYRDVRFSKDKAPYKTACGATLGEGYVQVSARGLAVGSGYYHLASDQLERYRQAVDDDTTGGELVDLVAEAEAQGVTVHGSEPLKTAPRGYAKDHPRIELLRYKGLIVWREWPVEPWLSTAAAKERVVAVLEAAQPMRRWLDRNVGPSEEPSDWRR